jgi:hypothetical protein
VSHGNSVSIRREKLNRLAVKLLQLGLLDFPFAIHLFNDQLGVQVDLESVRLPLCNRLEPVDKSVIFGLVVRGNAEVAVESTQPSALVIFDHDPNRGRAGIAASASVSAKTKGFQARTRMRPQFSQCTSSSPPRSFCMPDDVTVT